MGVLLISIGSKYWEMAKFLAVSLISGGYDGEFAIVTDQPESRWNEWDFCKAQIAPAQDDNPFRLKANIYTLSPFEKTLYLDVDAIFNAKYHKWEDFKKVFSRKNKLFIIEDVLEHDAPEGAMLWANHRLIYSHHDLDPSLPIYRVNSSLIYFKKSKENEAIFADAAKFYDNPVPEYVEIGGYYPDEIAFQAALHRGGYEQKETEWRPIYFTMYSGVQNTDRIKFPFLGFGGGDLPKDYGRLYNQINAWNHAKMEMSKPSVMAENWKLLGQKPLDVKNRWRN